MHGKNRFTNAKEINEYRGWNRKNRWGRNPVTARKCKMVLGYVDLQKYVVRKKVCSLIPT